jgi:peroxiredoxin
MLLLGSAGLANAQARRAPGFCLSDTTAQWRDLYDYRGKIVVIEFMQTTCPHCAAFAPKLAAVSQKYGGKVQVLAIALPPDNPNTMMEYVKGHNITYPLLLDMGQVAASYVREPNLRFPRIYLVDGDGLIRGTWEDGPLTKDVFEGNGLSKEIDRLLPAPTPAAPPAKKK